MLDKVLSFLELYITNISEVVKKVGKYKTASASLDALIRRGSFSKDELRKELSQYTKRIISIREFEEMLDYDRAEYTVIFYE